MRPSKSSTPSRLGPRLPQIGKEMIIGADNGWKAMVDFSLRCFSPALIESNNDCMSQIASNRRRWHFVRGHGSLHESQPRAGTNVLCLRSSGGPTGLWLSLYGSCMGEVPACLTEHKPDARTVPRAPSDPLHHIIRGEQHNRREGDSGRRAGNPKVFRTDLLRDPASRTRAREWASGALHADFACERTMHNTAIRYLGRPHGEAKHREGHRI